MKIDKLLIALSLIVGLSSCSDWLSLEPKDTTTETDLFETGDGYRIALNGIYQQMADLDLYGQELSWGFVEVAAQTYSTYGFGQATVYDKTAKYNYTDESVKEVVEAIWSKAYNNIANCNNIIQRVETESLGKFAEGEAERKLIEGEALALRAYLHLDMLRLFAPSMMKDDGRLYIPYVTTYPCMLQPYSTNRDVLDKALADLRKAKMLLEPFDTADLSKMLTLNRMENYRSPSDLFFAFRGYRMNYYAICALLARVYNYAGMHQEAFDEAGIVQEATAESEKCFTFTTPAGVSNGNIKLYHDIIFCLSDQNLWINYEPYHVSNNPLALKQNSELELFDESDTRKQLVAKIDYNLLSIRNVKASGESAAFSKDMVPMIRLGEMYYIRAEYYYSKYELYKGGGDVEKAKAELQKAKEELEKLRGGYNCPSDKLSDDIKQEVIKEAHREYLGEGQLFYFYKKFNIHPVRSMTDEQFVLPRPDNENL